MRRPIALVLGLSLCAGGCAALRALAGKNTLDLEGADVRSMGVDIRKPDKTICPREHVQMAVFADVVLKGETELKKVETWQGGPDSNRNGKLDFGEFAFFSEQGSFDDSGWFAPKPDVLATVAKELTIKTAYKRRPDKFTFTTSYKPDYRCIHGVGAGGDSGASGQSGQSGQSGEAGRTGSSTSSGGNGGEGGPGRPGGNGGQGSPGPKLAAFVSYVKTPFYEKLIAVRIEGGTSDFVLAHTEGQFAITARGGDGGHGGDGGRGGDGGSGGSGSPAGNGGNGAQGGNGGGGGNGGPGGDIELVFDDRFPELQGMIMLDVAGGAAGSAGHGGAGGSAGRGGSGFGNSPSGGDGTAGQAGAEGSAGSAGPNGSASARAGKVAEKFQNLSGITLL